MVIVKVPREIGKKVPNIEAHVRKSLISNVIYYIIDRKYRTMVNLQRWLKDELKAAEEHEGIKEVAETLRGRNADETMVNCLRWSNTYLTYITDDKKWNMPEKWEGVVNVFETKKGDCESGALLIYCVARLAGVPADKIWIMCGDVKGGGHAWIAYIPDEYPLNFTFMDWCYWYKNYTIHIRNKYTIADKAIHEYDYKGNKLESNYYKLWFVFNEVTSYREFR